MFSNTRPLKGQTSPKGRKEHKENIIAQALETVEGQEMLLKAIKETIKKAVHNALK